MIYYFYQTFYFFFLSLHRRSSWGGIRHEKRFSSKISLKQKLDYIRSFFFIATSQYWIILIFFSFILYLISFKIELIIILIFITWKWEKKIIWNWKKKCSRVFFLNTIMQRISITMTATLFVNYVILLIFHYYHYSVIRLRKTTRRIKNKKWD